MKKTQEITCIVCPLGCRITITTQGNSISSIQGEKCKRGKEYAYSEALDPRRVLTTSVLVVNGQWPLVSVKTTEPVPKKDLCAVLDAIKKICVFAPVQCGQILSQNIAGTGVMVVATKSVDKIS